jgi:hypothetical protein
MLRFRRPRPSAYDSATSLATPGGTPEKVVDPGTPGSASLARLASTAEAAPAPSTPPPLSSSPRVKVIDYVGAAARRHGKRYR